MLFALLINTPRHLESERYLTQYASPSSRERGVHASMKYACSNIVAVPAKHSSYCTCVWHSENGRSLTSKVSMIKEDTWQTDLNSSDRQQINHSHHQSITFAFLSLLEVHLLSQSFVIENDSPWKPFSPARRGQSDTFAR